MIIDHIAHAPGNVGVMDQYYRHLPGRGHAADELIGMRFGALTVIEAYAHGYGVSTTCRCDCGAEIKKSASGFTRVSACGATCPSKPKPLPKKKPERPSRYKPRSSDDNPHRRAQKVECAEAAARRVTRPRVAKEVLITWSQLFGSTARTPDWTPPPRDDAPRVYDAGTSVIAALACTHLTTYADLLPTVGQHVLCLQCGERQEIVDLVLSEVTHPATREPAAL